MSQRHILFFMTYDEYPGIKHSVQSDAVTAASTRLRHVVFGQEISFMIVLITISASLCSYRLSSQWQQCLTQEYQPKLLCLLKLDKAYIFDIVIHHIIINLFGFQCLCDGACHQLVLYVQHHNGYLWIDILFLHC